MFRLDDNFLNELGLGALPPQEKNAMLRHILETLELRVGMKLAENMSNQQLSDFEKLMPKQDDAEDAKKQKEQQALKWLESSFPDYKKVVGDELETLKAEIQRSAPDILANSANQQ